MYNLKCKIKDNFVQNMKASLIILTYNELEEGTKPCIESIYKYTDKEDFELIIVDNNSTDGTQEYLRELEAKYNNVKLKLNTKNKGFAAGMNDGIRISNGKYVVLMNNDVLVSPNWLLNLLKPLDLYDNVALASPNSNLGGAEQSIYISGMSPSNYVEKVQNYLEANKGHIYYSSRTGFFVVAIKKAIIDSIGMLDEKFGKGMFEDDDYCLRIKKAGYDLVMVEDSFVYHLGSLSFRKANTDMVYHNYLYFNKKHNTNWTMTNYVIQLVQKIESDLNEYVKKTDQIPAELQRVMCRIKPLLDLVKLVNNQEIDFRIKTKLSKWNLFKRNYKYYNRQLRLKIKSILGLQS